MRSAIFVTSAILACAGVPHIAAGQAMKKPEGPTRYLKSSDFPDPRSYLPTPPVPGTPAFAADRAAYTAALAGKDGAAWKRAVAQLRLRSPIVDRQLMCAIGAKLDSNPDSAYRRLMLRSFITLNDASEQAKAAWNRDRPHAGEKGAATCDPGAGSSPSPSYPSGSAGVGWLWALMLSQLVPDRTEQLLRWGAEVGANRVVCRVHYPSDVDAGRLLGSVLYARLQADPIFRADMEAARAEIASARTGGAPAGCDVD